MLASSIGITLEVIMLDTDILGMVLEAPTSALGLGMAHEYAFWTSGTGMVLESAMAISEIDIALMFSTFAFLDSKKVQ